MYRRNELPPFAGVSLGSEANAVLALGYRAGPILVGPELHGLTTLENAFERRSTPIEALLGAHASVGDVRVGAGLGTLLVGGLGAAKVRAVFSLEWVPRGVSARDRDHDGVIDADDACPDVPGLASAELGSRGCPAPPRDADRDGIFDTDDACPDLAGIRTREPMTHGCPDADRDGIPDPLDACPKISGERSVLPRFNGCPADADGDGVLDLQDACPEQPGFETGDEATNGCPRAAPPPDRDEDGVTDGEDACPDEKGAASSEENQNGCPPVRVVDGLIALTRAIELAPAPAKRPVAFTQESEQSFADIANFLVLAHPEITRVRVSARGDIAQAAVERLVIYGVSRRRLEVRGVADPAKSRHVELRVLK
jgi:OOP family OmpA-OmpF porin